MSSIGIASSAVILGSSSDTSLQYRVPCEFAAYNNEEGRIALHRRTFLGAIAASLTPGLALSIARPGLRGPYSVYINWAAYDELSDNVELTEELAMFQLGHVERLRKAGVRIDAYLNDCFWFAPDGAYRTFRKPHWPAGPDRWLAECKKLGVAPGLWVGTNTHRGLDINPAWKSSYDPKRTAFCLFQGGFLTHFMDSLQLWYDRGVRVFKFDFANLDAATPAAEKFWTPPEIRAMNETAFRTALAEFRFRNPEVRFLAYNGFGGEMSGTATPIRKTVDLRWLDAFDSLYCGDPRPADVPAWHFWRSKDIYSDHMVRYYLDNGVPLERIDNSSFMIGVTGTCYGRRSAAWKGMLMLSLARGGWMNTYYGNMELLNETDARWFAEAQRLFLPLQDKGRVTMFGAVPGSGEPYGYAALATGGIVYTVVNPSQSVAEISLPYAGDSTGRLLFADRGFEPRLSRGSVVLGPEQMAVVGTGSLSSVKFDFGRQEDVAIPVSIQRLTTKPAGANANAPVLIDVPAGSDLRVIARQTRPDGEAIRTTGGSPPNGTTLGKMLKLSAVQGGKPVQIDIQYDKAIWSGLSWASGEIPAARLTASTPVQVACSSTETQPHSMAFEAYAVRYR